MQVIIRKDKRKKDLFTIAMITQVHLAQSGHSVPVCGIKECVQPSRNQVVMGQGGEADALLEQRFQLQLA